LVGAGPLPLRSILLNAARKETSEISPLSSPLAACHASDADTVETGGGGVGARGTWVSATV
jgi:hypothetical protein